MNLESSLIERVETFIRHPVFEGSAEVMEEVLGDLESHVTRGRVRQETYHDLRDKILRSPHLIRRKAS